MRLSAFDAAKMFIQTEFPECLGAILSGSVAIGKETATSDLDIVVFEKRVNVYRKSVIKYDWMIEVFVYDLESYKPFFESDVKRARPTLPRMLAEGMVIKHHEEMVTIVNLAKETMLAGPPKWDDKTVEFHQYFLTDVVNDFIGSENVYESFCIAATLLDKLHEFILRTNQHWVGSSKWMYREMDHFNPDLTKEVFQAFQNYYQKGEKNGIINVVESVLDPFGGKRFEGFQLGK